MLCLRSWVSLLRGHEVSTTHGRYRIQLGNCLTVRAPPMKDLDKMGTCTRSCQLIASSFSPALVLAPKVGSRRFVASADSGRAIGSRKLRLLQHGRVIPAGMAVLLDAPSNCS